MTRQSLIQQFTETPQISVLIVGGGINGIGTFYDLALQGVDCLLVDRGDYCSGASSASSHMIHGGIRYLENGEFRLVREAVKERNLLLKNAPHAVKPLPTTIPIFKRFSGLLNAPLKFLRLLNKPSERGSLVVRIGLILYNQYTRAHQSMPGHFFLNRKDSLAQFPRLNPEIIQTATYYDSAISSPERLCIELLREARAVNTNAHALNYVSAVRGEGDTITLHDELTGNNFSVKPQIIVNAAGPWIDSINFGMGRETQFIGGTKGSHLVLDAPELREAIGDHEIFFENEDGRIALIFPFLERVLIGTTDIRIDDPDSAKCTPEEVDYMLDMVRRVFPTIAVTEEQIVFRFSGVRPLPSVPAKATGQISRDHRIKFQPPDDKLTIPVYNLIGGKWTTFRAFAEQATDLCLKALKKSRNVSTELRPFGGGKSYPENPDQWISDRERETGVDNQIVSTLFERYGTESADIITRLGERPEPLESIGNYYQEELRHIITHEEVYHLDDLLLRRTLIGMQGYITSELIEECATLMAECLEWSAEEKSAQVKRVVAMLKYRHGLSL